MEVVLFFIIIFLVGLIVYLIWKNHCLQRDIYDFNHKLDSCLNDLLNEKEIESKSYNKDSLWEMIYERLLRLSNMYSLKNKEIIKEKETLKELVGDISHQTKTPIANIKLYLEILLLDKKDIGSEIEYLKKINVQVDKLDFLLQSMVKISRLETDVIKIQKKVNSVFEMLVVAINAVVLKADKKNITIHVDCDEKILLNFDKKWTGEAVFNILDNAIKYTESNGNIYVSVCKQEIFTKIAIQDTGKGIALNRQGLIFSRFYREPEIHDDEGIGIGLYLARKIITLQDGYIEVKSEVGQGSTFIIYLPN